MGKPACDLWSPQNPLGAGSKTEKSEVRSSNDWEPRRSALGAGLAACFSGLAMQHHKACDFIAGYLRIEPDLKSDLESLEHFLLDVFDVSELGPRSNITAFKRTLNLYDKLFHQVRLVLVFFPQMMFANARSPSLSMLGL